MLNDSRGMKSGKNNVSMKTIAGFAVATLLAVIIPQTRSSAEDATVLRYAPVSSDHNRMEGGTSGFACRGEDGPAGRRSNERRSVRDAFSVS